MIKRFFRFLLKLRGWQVADNGDPALDKAILIFAPHTSNWDFPIMLMAKFAWGFPVRYLGKHTLFQWPIGWFFRALGGMPVERSKAHNMVDQVVMMVEREQKIYLALAPEGTRSYTDYWKTGFYHIAQRTKLPILMYYMDTTSKTIGRSEPLYTTDDINADFEIIADFYKDKRGYLPELTSIVQTKAQYIANKRAESN